MKKKIVAAFCLAMVMTVGGCSGAGTAAQPESSESQTQLASVSESRAVLTLRKRIPRRNPHHPQLLPMPQMHRAAEIFLRWIRT